MAAKDPDSVHEGAPSSVEPELPLQSLEESLLSMEKLDRASPDLWPEQIPGVSEFAPSHPGESPPSWNISLTAEDMNCIQRMSTMNTSSLIMEVKKMHDLAYQLGTEEAKEMTRGKYLNVFTSRRPR